MTKNDLAVIEAVNKLPETFTWKMLSMKLNTLGYWLSPKTVRKRIYDGVVNVERIDIGLYRKVSKEPQRTLESIAGKTKQESEWVEFILDGTGKVYDGNKYRTKDGFNFEFLHPDGIWFRSEYSNQIKEYYESNIKPNIGLFNYKHIDKITSKRPLTLSDIENSEPYKMLKNERDRLEASFNDIATTNDVLRGKIEELEKVIEENVDNSYRWNDKVKELKEENERLIKEKTQLQESIKSMDVSVRERNGELVRLHFDLKDKNEALAKELKFHKNLSWLKRLAISYGSLAVLYALYHIVMEVLK